MSSSINGDVVKGLVATQLHKLGYTLGDFEQALEKQALIDTVKDLGGLTGDTLLAAFAGAAGLGAVQGTMGYGVYDRAKKTDSKIQEQLQALLELQEANARLKTELGRRQTAAKLSTGYG